MNAGDQPRWTTTPKGARMAKLVIGVVLVTVFLCGAGAATLALLFAWLLGGGPR